MSASAGVQLQHRQNWRYLLLIIAVVAVSLASIFTFGPTINQYNDTIELSVTSRRLQSLGMYLDPKSVDIKQFSVEHKNQNIVTADTVNNPTTNSNIQTTTYSDLVHNENPLPKYTLEQIIEAADTMRSKYSILHYDPTKDRFTGYYSKNQRWVTGCYKLLHSLSALTILLRSTFPQRFTPDQPELFLGVSAGDYPAMTDQDCIYKDQDGPCDQSDRLKAPVLHFGSVFRKPMFPNIIGE